MILFELPYPPTVNHYYRRVGAKTLISSQGRRYRQRVCEQLIILGLARRPLQGDLAMTLKIYPPDRRRRDIDNVLKSLLDALQHGGLYRDDNQIKRLTIEMLPPARRGRAFVQLEEVA